ncbi:hypothetical protein QJQ45_029533 [Haematococcus lacustris]|nr:hypothetical protein QJQ45_029533 [Haematococcus lacustris]
MGVVGAEVQRRRGQCGQQWGHDASPAPEPAPEPALLAVASNRQLESSMRVWVAVSGASRHITPERSLLLKFQAFVQPVPMGQGKSSVPLYAYGKGRVRLATDGVRMELQDVLWVPEASTNYYSTRVAAQKGWEVRQTADTITMESSKGELVKGRVVGRRYQLSGSAQPAVVASLRKAKSEVPAAIRDAVEWFETQGGRKVKVLRSDRGTEYVTQAVREFLSEKGNIYRQTVPYSPQQDGSAERLNRTLFEKGRCLPYSSELSVDSWPYALRFANYVRNLSLVRAHAQQAA